MQVRKRDGSLEKVDPNKILKRIEQQCYGLNKMVEPMEIAKKVIDGLIDGISARELDLLAIETSAILTGNHPDFSILASRIALSNLYKETKNSFSDTVHFLFENTKLLDKNFYKIVMKNADLIDRKIDHKKDKLFDYFGFKTLERSYLLRQKNKLLNIDRVCERPQYLWMRVSIGIWGENLKEAFKTYSLMSDGYFTHATPTLFNAGTKKPQLSSCFLVANKGDDIDGLFDTLKNVAKISKWAGGIGLHVHDVRATGSLIHGTGGKSDGLMPMLKTYNDVARWINQGGKRRGSFAIYLEPWHRDIYDLLDMKKNHGKEEMRARDLFTALWIPDLFMQRVEENGEWTLFCPNEVLLTTGKSLQDYHSAEFNTFYIECEKLNIGKKINARDLWNHILNAQIETGNPYMLYKDACNSKSNQQNLGTIKSSNLCCEVVEYSEPNETAVCNLASIALSKFIVEGKFDFDLLIFVTQQIVRNINQIIDINYYPIPETKISNLKHRPIGIGVQGLADAFAILGIAFDSSEAIELNKNIFETIYYASLTESCKLSKEQGPYTSFSESPSSQGILQFDMWGIVPKMYNWIELKKDIIKNGLRNSLLIAPMPTASTAQILGNNECFEPFNSNISSRRTLAGEFTIINKYLVYDLERLGLWDMTMKQKLISENGSVKNIPEIPTELKEKYKTAYEISQKVIINMAADRGAYICQSQSMNIFMENPNIAKLSSMHFYGWKAGLKTGMYYLRTKAAADAIKFTVEKEIIPPTCSIDNPDCETCSA